MTTEEKLDLIKQVGEEIIGEDQLKTLLESNEPLIAYDGFEPSGQIHIAQGLQRAINVNRMTKAGVKFRMWVADWHALANNKMGGDLKKIQTVGKYFVEVWKACGMDLTNVEFMWASEFAKNPDYWQLVVRVGRSNALRRFIRTAEMMGREESLDNLTGANIIYSCMQVADVFMLGAKITQLGMDQRKLNMLAREVGPLLSPPAGGWKPVVVSHHMLMGLDKPPSKTQGALNRIIALKMSKSKPDSAIFMTDTLEDIQRKITKAYCPEGEIAQNPILEYCKYIIFPALEGILLLDIKDMNFEIVRPDKFGGNKIYKTYSELKQDFSIKKLHPMDLKQAVIKKLDALMTPVRQHFETNKVAADLLAQVKSFQITR